MGFRRALRALMGMLRRAFTDLKFFSYRPSLDILVHIALTISPLGWIALLRSISRLKRCERLAAMGYPPYIFALSNISIKRLGKLISCYQLLWGLRFLVPDLASLFVYYHIWLRQDYEKVAGPREGDVVIDVGAHVGLFTLRCLRHYQAKRVVAVEHHPLNCKLLRYNVAMNGFKDKVIIVKKAAGQEEGSGELFIGTP